MPPSSADIGASLGPVVADTEYIRVGAGWMFVECGFKFTKPLTDFNLSVSTDDALVLEYEETVPGGDGERGKRGEGTER